MTTGTRIELHIRRLVWDEPCPPSTAALCAAVESELAVLLGNSPSADPLAPAVPADSALIAHARRIARAVHEALRTGQPPASDAVRTPGPPPEAGAPTP